MARFEVALATDLRFSASGRRPTKEVFPDPETVAPPFAGHEFVWHEVDSDHDPTLTVVLEADDEATRTAVATAAQRLLPALAFHCDCAIASVSYGGPAGRPMASADRRLTTLRVRAFPEHGSPSDLGGE